MIYSTLGNIILIINALVFIISVVICVRSTAKALFTYLDSIPVGNNLKIHKERYESILLDSSYSQPITLNEFIESEVAKQRVGLKHLILKSIKSFGLVLLTASIFIIYGYLVAMNYIPKL